VTGVQRGSFSKRICCNYESGPRFRLGRKKSTIAGLTLKERVAGVFEDANAPVTTSQNKEDSQKEKRGCRFPDKKMQPQGHRIKAQTKGTPQIMGRKRERTHSRGIQAKLRNVLKRKRGSLSAFGGRRILSAVVSFYYWKAVGGGKRRVILRIDESFRAKGWQPGIWQKKKGSKSVFTKMIMTREKKEGKSELPGVGF